MCKADLQIPNKLSPEKQKEISDWRAECIRFRLCMDGEKCTSDHVYCAISTAKELLREWDDACGIETMQGDWK